MTRTPNFDADTLTNVRAQINRWASWVLGSSSAEACAWLAIPGFAPRTAAPTALVSEDRDEEVTRVNQAMTDLSKVHYAALRAVLFEYLHVSTRQEDRACMAGYGLARYRQLLDAATLFITGRLMALKSPKTLEII